MQGIAIFIHNSFHRLWIKHPLVHIQLQLWSPFRPFIIQKGLVHVSLELCFAEVFLGGSVEAAGAEASLETSKMIGCTRLLRIY